VIDRVGSSEFARLRLGVDRGPGNSADYVLSRFPPGERRAAEGMVVRGAEIAEHWVEHGTMSAMNRYNRRVNAEDQGQDD
jgi:peptidyl-tRNA hydrolase